MSTMDESSELFKLFGKIHNYIYANEGFSAQEAFNEFIKFLFIKFDTEKDSSFPKMIISEETYKNIMDGKKTELKRKVDGMFEHVKKDYADIFHSSEQINLKEPTLAYLIKSLQEINFNNIENDVKGIAFQKFIFSSQRDSRGQFLTPDPIMELATNFVKPSPKDKVVDPACGTGGFLVHSLRYVEEHYDATKTKQFLSNLVGIEISPSVAKLAKVRMIFEGDGHTGILETDSLSSFETLEQHTGKEMEESFDMVLTNPPFGTQGKISDKTYLKNFALGHVWEKDRNEETYSNSELQSAQTPEILFIERCLQLLKEGGKLAIVLPDGILENRTLTYVRNYIKKSAKLMAVVSLPSKTFIPHGTGIKTSIVFLQKLNSKKESEIKDYPVFFSIIENVGYEGNKNATPIYDKYDEENPILKEDITKVIELFNKFENGSLKSETELGFYKNFSEIEDRIDAEYYKPAFSKLSNWLTKKGAKQLGELVEIKSKKADILSDPNAEIGYIEITDVNSSTSEIIGTQKLKAGEAPSRASYEVREGEIITEVAGVSTGTKNHATALVTKEFDGAVCTNGFRVLVPKAIDPYYLVYYLNSDLFLQQMLRCRTGSAIPSVVEEDLRHTLVLIPEKEKQQEIISKVKEAYRLRDNAKKKLAELYENNPLGNR